jgi:subtilisin family serine protease
MAHVYSVTGEKIALTLSPNDIGVRFETPDVAARAFRSVRASVSAPTATGPGLYQIAPRRFDRTLLLHDPGAARTAFSTVRSALSARLATNVRRTLPVYIEAESKLRVIVTREITVRFKPGTTERQRAKVLKSLNLIISDPNEFNPRQYIVIPAADVDESDTIRLANILSESKDVVEYAAPNFVSEHRKFAPPNDRLLSDQWHLNNIGGNGAVAGEDVKALAAWELTAGGSAKIVIAIIDDGVDVDHADLRANIWVNPDTTAPDRNGRNFFDNDYDPRPRYFQRPYDETDTNDIHGTPCAGVAAAVGNNKVGGAGIAYNCKILPVKILGGEGLAPNDRIANAIRYAGRHADVLSNSWGIPRHPDVESAINDVVRTGRHGKGCLVFCATGNEYERQIGFPASHPSALAVGASNDRGKRS